MDNNRQIQELKKEVGEMKNEISNLGYKNDMKIMDIDTKTDKSISLIAQSMQQLGKDFNKGIDNLNTGLGHLIDKQSADRAETHGMIKEIEQEVRDIKKDLVSALGFAKGTWFAIGAVGALAVTIFIRLYK
ncbi:MAG: hypothetical protein GY746_00145 [Gammaproteobacteria bacterium]|nr:hypothetical protein [Gammaproteobacteria bacterium]MCP4488156.1 hypothetical protein [Gammaproteobacteria bacterium]